jgi:thymidylate synthase ThyX
MNQQHYYYHKLRLRSHDEQTTLLSQTEPAESTGTQLKQKKLRSHDEPTTLLSQTEAVESTGTQLIQKSCGVTMNQHHYYHKLRMRSQQQHN